MNHKSATCSTQPTADDGARLSAQAYSTRLFQGVCHGVWNINSLRLSIRSEQVRLIYRQGPVMVVGATLIAVLMAIFLWQHVSHQGLLFWLMLIFTSAALRAWVFRSFDRHGMNEPQSQPGIGPWGTLFWVGSMISGAVWGVMPFLLYPHFSPEYLLLISTVFAGMVAVTASAGSIYLPSFYSFSLPLVVPLIFSHLTSGLDYLFFTGVLLLFFLLVNVVLAQRGYRQYAELIEARFSNADLMVRLSAEKSIAEKAVLAKNKFLAAASHDLRQPLHAMGLFIASLRKRESNTERLDIITDMEASTHALGQLLHSLLDMSKLDAGVIRVEQTHVDLDKLLKTMSAEFKPWAIQKHLSFRIDKTCATLFTDPLLLERVLRNLLSNAIQYTAHGQVAIGVEQGSDDRVQVTVSDTGIGIPDSEQESVFVEYMQLQSGVVAAPDIDAGVQDVDEHGLGLGLAIVDRLCHLLDVPLTMQSTTGIGTTFTLSILSGQPIMVTDNPETSDLSDLSGSVVMVIDDDQQVAGAMRGMLSDWGCRVICATSARDALFQLAVENCIPDTILCDYRLGDQMTGLDVIEALREGAGRYIPAAIITGDTSPERLREVARSQLKILHKPVLAPVLKVTLAECLRDGPHISPIKLEPGAQQRQPASGRLNPE